jgi:hypothetical protein
MSITARVLARSLHAIARFCCRIALPSAMASESQRRPPSSFSNRKGADYADWHAVDSQTGGVIGMTGYWIMGYAIQMGGLGAISTLGGTGVLDSEFTISLFGKDFGLFGMKGFFLAGTSYDVAVFTLFLFQMVFMDTAATIPTGAMAERWKFPSFVVFGFFLSRSATRSSPTGSGAAGGCPSSARTSGSDTATSTSRARRSCTWSAA